MGEFVIYNTERFSGGDRTHFLDHNPGLAREIHDSSSPLRYYHPWEINEDNDVNESFDSNSDGDLDTDSDSRDSE